MEATAKAVEATAKTVEAAAKAVEATAETVEAAAIAVEAATTKADRFSDYNSTALALGVGLISRQKTKSRCSDRQRKSRNEFPKHRILQNLICGKGTLLLRVLES